MERNVHHALELAGGLIGCHSTMTESPTVTDFSALHNGENLWVFGYGSLMWRPGFDFLEQRQAVLHGYRRSFCIYSHHHRGTKENPGLVLGLDKGGSCVGCAFHVRAGDVGDVVAYLNERELIGYAYTPRLLEVALKNGDRPDEEEVVQTYTFVADRSHEQYAGDLSVEAAASLIMNAEGIAGLNREYLINTIRHLEQTGFAEPELHALLREVESRTGMIDLGGGI